MGHEVSKQAAARPQIALAEVVDGLRDELERLRVTVDQLRNEIQFVVGMRHAPPHHGPVLRITSLSKDPTAPDFLQRINAVPPEQLDTMRAELLRSGRRQDEDAPM